jgi:hypothetical protein
MGVSRHIRVVWIVIASVFTIATIGFGTLQAVAGIAHEERDERTVVDGPVRVLDIDASGSVTVIGRDGGPVRIDEHVSRGLHAPQRSIRVDGDRLSVRGTCRAFPDTWCSEDVVIRAPRNVAVIARGEGITVRGIRGAMRLSSHDGSIAGRALRTTTVEARTDDGNISLAFAVPPDHVDASSRDGSVEVGVPDGPVSYRVDAETRHGSESTRVRTDPDGDRTIRARSDDGDVTVRYTNEEEG